MQKFEGDESLLRAIDGLSISRDRSSAPIDSDTAFLLPDYWLGELDEAGVRRVQKAMRMQDGFLALALDTLAVLRESDMIESEDVLTFEPARAPFVAAQFNDGFQGVLAADADDTESPEETVECDGYQLTVLPESGRVRVFVIKAEQNEVPEPNANVVLERLDAEGKVSARWTGTTDSTGQAHLDGPNLVEQAKAGQRYVFRVVLATDPLGNPEEA